LDGGRKAIAAREHQKGVVIKSVRPLGHYVEENCKDDMTTFLKSGFQLVSSTRTVGTPASLDDFLERPGSGTRWGHAVDTLG
jgi:hypothetical protein